MKFLFKVNNNGKVWSSVVGNLPTLWQVVNQSVLILILNKLTYDLTNTQLMLIN